LAALTACHDVDLEIPISDKLIANEAVLFTMVFIHMSIKLSLLFKLVCGQLLSPDLLAGGANKIFKWLFA